MPDATDDKQHVIQNLLTNVPSHDGQNTNMHQGLAMINLLDKNCKQKRTVQECQAENDYCTWVDDTFWGSACLNTWAYKRALFERSILVGDLAAVTVEDVEQMCAKETDKRKMGYCKKFISECKAVKREAIAFEKKLRQLLHEKESSEEEIERIANELRAAESVSSHDELKDRKEDLQAQVVALNNRIVDEKRSYVATLCSKRVHYLRAMALGGLVVDEVIQAIALATTELEGMDDASIKQGIIQTAINVAKKIQESVGGPREHARIMEKGLRKVDAAGKKYLGSKIWDGVKTAVKIGAVGAMMGLIGSYPVAPSLFRRRTLGDRLVTSMAGAMVGAAKATFCSKDIKTDILQLDESLHPCCDDIKVHRFKYVGGELHPLYKGQHLGLIAEDVANHRIGFPIAVRSDGLYMDAIHSRSIDWVKLCECIDSCLMMEQLLRLEGLVDTRRGPSAPLWYMLRQYANHHVETGSPHLFLTFLAEKRGDLRPQRAVATPRTRPRKAIDDDPRRTSGVRTRRRQKNDEGGSAHATSARGSGVKTRRQQKMIQGKTSVQSLLMASRDSQNTIMHR